MNKYELRKEVLEFRNGLLGKKTIKRKCFAICSALNPYLNIIGYEADLIWGDVMDVDTLWGHYWIRFANKEIIDPTAGQFFKFSNLQDGIYIGELPLWFYPREIYIDNEKADFT